MAYTTASEIYKAWGQEHIEKWADLDNDGNATTIANHIAWAISLADEIIDSRMRSTHYLVPLQAADGSTPTLIQHISTELSGWLIHTNKGEYLPADQDPYRVRHDRAMGLLESLAEGKLKIDAVIGA